MSSRSQARKRRWSSARETPLLEKPRCQSAVWSTLMDEGMTNLVEGGSAMVNTFSGTASAGARLLFAHHHIDFILYL
jgi:hypothetical protein